MFKFFLGCGCDLSLGALLFSKGENPPVYYSGFFLIMRGGGAVTLGLVTYYYLGGKIAFFCF